MSEASTLGASVAGEPVAPESVAPEPVLPPSPRIPRPLEALAFVTNRRRTVEWLTRKYGRAVTVRIPVFGDSVLIADPVLAKQVFTTSCADATVHAARRSQRGPRAPVRNGAGCRLAGG